MLALFGVHLSQYVKKGIKSNLHFTHLFPFHELIQRSSAAIPTQTKVTSNKSLSEKRLQNYDFALHVLFSAHLMSLVDSLLFQRTLCFLVSPHEQTSTLDSPVTSFALKRMSSRRTGSSKNSGSEPMPNLALFPWCTKRHCLSPPMRSIFDTATFRRHCWLQCSEVFCNSWELHDRRCTATHYMVQIVKVSS